MKYPSKIYALALAEALKNESSNKESLIKRFVFLIGKNKDWHKRKEILNSVDNVLREMFGTIKIEVESARPLPFLIKNLRSDFGNKAEIIEKNEKEIIAGARVVINNQIRIERTITHVLNVFLS